MTQNETADLSSLRIQRNVDPSFSGAPKSKLTLRIGVTLFLVAIAVVGYLLIANAVAPAVEVKLTSVSYSSPSQANAVLTASGYVVAQRKAAVASKGTGRLEYLGVVEGDRVKKGEVIARIENSDIQAQVDQARANLKLSEAELHDARQSLSRYKNLLEKGLAPQSEYDAAEARYGRVLASIDVAKALVTSAEVALENMLIRAPFDGTVLAKNADVGEMVAPMAASVSSRSAVVTIADMSSLQVEADVSEANIERIVPDQSCEITLDAYPEIRYQGYVAKIVPTADRAKATVLVKVAFRSYDSKVLPEMSAKTLFLTKAPNVTETSAKPILTLPTAAVATRGGESLVFAVVDNKASQIPVKTGRTLGSLVEILSGVGAGDRVIATVTDEIYDGVTVKVK